MNYQRPLVNKHALLLQERKHQICATLQIGFSKSNFHHFLKYQTLKTKSYKSFYRNQYTKPLPLTVSNSLNPRKLPVIVSETANNLSPRFLCVCPNILKSLSVNSHTYHIRSRALLGDHVVFARTILREIIQTVRNLSSPRWRQKFKAKCFVEIQGTVTIGFTCSCEKM